MTFEGNDDGQQLTVDDCGLERIEIISELTTRTLIRDQIKHYHWHKCNQRNTASIPPPPPFPPLTPDSQLHVFVVVVWRTEN